MVLMATTLSARMARPMMRPAVMERFSGDFTWAHVEDLIIDNLNRDGGEEQTLCAAVPSYSPGFSVGVIANYNPHIDWSIRVLADTTTLWGSSDCSLGLGRRRATKLLNRYRCAPVRSSYHYWSSTALCTSTTLALTSWGASTACSIWVRKRVQFAPLSAGWAFGVGCDIYLRYFKLSPSYL